MHIDRGRPDGAAFLDGLSDEDLADFALALQVQAELEAQDGVVRAPEADDDPTPLRVHRGEIDPDVEARNPPDAGPGVIPLHRPGRGPRRLRPRWRAGAALLAGVLLVPFALRTTRGAVKTPSQAVAMLGDPAAGLPAGWEDNVVWRQTRGDCGVVTEAGRPARLGAYMVQLELAVRARNADQTRLLVARADCLLAEVDAGVLVSSSLRPLAEQPGGDPAALLPHVRDANELAGDVLDGGRFALGAWAEAARLAVARRDADFFRNARSRGTLNGADAVVGDDEAARAAVAGMRTSVQTDPPDWDGLRRASDTLLAAVAS